MSEVFFYHLTQTRLEAALPKILERAVSTDWLVELRIGMETDVESISDAIWTGPDDSPRRATRAAAPPNHSLQARRRT